METRAIKVDDRVFRVQLERFFWECLDDIVEGLDITIQRLVNHCSSRHVDDIASNLRVFVLEHYQQQAGVDLGDLAAGSPFLKH